MEANLIQAVKLHVIVTDDGKIQLEGLPFKKGEEVEMLVMSAAQPNQRRYMTAKDLLESDLVGMWADRDDIGDSVEFARKLREQAQRRDLDVDWP